MIQTTLWTICILVILSPLTYQMECTYGERGSLTVYCTNATSSYFKLSPYRFDHLDETLKCINCSLTVLGQGTFDLSGNYIKTLDIRNSSISQITQKAFIGLIFVEKVLLSNNPISNISQGAFIGARKIKYLEMENAVSSLSDNVFQDLHILEVLILSGGSLSSLPDGTFNGLHNLNILDLSSNRLTTLSKNTFASLVNLRSLKLQNNKLTRIMGYEFSNLKKLLLLNLADNAITNFTVDIESDNNWRILNLANNHLLVEDIIPGTFRNLNQLEELYLGHNSLRIIPPRVFQGLYRLRILDLSNNQIKEFTTGSFSGLPHLLTLNVSSNNLKSARVSGRLLLHSLHTLDLSDNRITNLDYIDIVSRMPRITTINMYNNYLPCEAMYELQLLFNEDHHRFLVSTNYSKAGVCKGVDMTVKDAMKIALQEHYRSEETSRGTMAWVILLVIIIHLVAILFYVQFYVLSRSKPSFRFSVLRRQNGNS